jgi:SAM-dependent methyltransferase
MGIDARSLEALCVAARSGPLGRCVTLGRQHVYERTRTLDAVAARFGLNGLSFEQGHSTDTDSIFRLLGASSIDAIDISAFEGATLLADLSKPMPPEWAGRFDLVCDFGTLEHVFNVAMAVENSIQLLRPGGRLLSVGPANSLLGHGFFQFSAEFWYSVFRANDFVQPAVFVATRRYTNHWFHHPDPAVIGRTQIAVSEPLYVIATAIRGEKREFLPPFESDYEELWRAHSSGVPAPSRRKVKTLRSRIASRLRPYTLARYAQLRPVVPVSMTSF